MCPTPIHGRIRVSDIFPYRTGELYAEDVPISRIAAAVGTPFYLYSTAGFTTLYRKFAAAFLPDRPLICFAVKANSNLAVLRHFAALGAGADVVSEGELRRALAAGMPPNRIIFSGVGKTATELEAALAADIHQINVESVPELLRLSEIATAQGRVAPVGIRVNPDVAANTHNDISTGRCIVAIAGPSCCVQVGSSTGRLIICDGRKTLRAVGCGANRDQAVDFSARR